MVLFKQIQLLFLVLKTQGNLIFFMQHVKHYVIRKKLVYLKQSTFGNQQKEIHPEWDKWIPNLDVLAVENIEKYDEDTLHELGNAVDLALNHDVLVLLTYAGDVDELEASRLKELVRQGLNASIGSPSQHSLLLHLRRKSMMESAGLTDDLLSAVVKHSDKNWKTAVSQFEKLVIAIESGIDVQDGEDAEKILLDAYFEDDEKEVDKQHIQIMAQKLVKNAIDEVYTEKDAFGVDLHTEMPEIGTESYEPPSLKPDLNQSLQEKKSFQKQWSLISHQHSTYMNQNDIWYIRRTNFLDSTVLV